MPLSDYEQRVIDDLERSLERDDPKLAKVFNGGGSAPYTKMITIAVGVMLGIAMLILGSVISQPLLVAVGFGAIFISLARAAISKRSQPKDLQDTPVDYLALHPKELATSNSSESSGRFMGKLEDRWNRRQSELG